MSYAYPIVGGKDNDEQSLFFMLNALLQARIDVGDETTDDEDVNVYLASLLHSLLEGAHRERELVSEYDEEISRMADVGDLRTRFQVYKANADYALVACALFDRKWVNRRRGRRSLAPREDHLESRGRLYYNVASSLSQKLKYGTSAVIEVLGKLSGRFDTYTQVLSRVGSSHLPPVREAVAWRGLSPGTGCASRSEARTDPVWTRSISGRVWRVRVQYVGAGEAEGQSSR